MSQRLAVLLAVASILVIACAAEGPSMEPAATQKYDKKPHNKHEKHDKPAKYDKEYTPDGYKPDGYKPDGYYPDGYKPVGNKPDGYKPDGYKPDGYKPDDYTPSYEQHYAKHHKSKEHHDKEYYGSGPRYNGEHDSYAEPNPTYNSGYYGGYGGYGGGHHILHLDTLKLEKLEKPLLGGRLNQTVVEGDEVSGRFLFNFGFDLMCGLRKTSPYAPADKPYGYGDDKYGSIIKGDPKEAVSVGKGSTLDFPSWDNLDLTSIFADFFDSITGSAASKLVAPKLVLINGNQKAYEVKKITGSIKFDSKAEECHPMLKDSPDLKFENMPVYLTMGKIPVSTDPKDYFLGALGKSRVDTTTASVGKASKHEYKKSEYSKSCGDEPYHCGYIMVAKGKVTLKAGENKPAYTGVCEYVTGFADGLTQFPILGDILPIPRLGADLLSAFSDRLDGVCHLLELPLANIGSWRCEFDEDHPNGYYNERY